MTGPRLYGVPVVTAAAWRKPVPEELEPDRDDVGVLAELFAAHAAPLFDYCRALTGSDAEAASATVAALVRAPRLPRAPHLLRARLFASARRRALLPGPAGAVRRPEFTLVSPDQRSNGVLAVFGALAVRHREVLALVYRYGIWAEQLAVVLRVAARDSYELLAAAEHGFVTVAAAAGAAGSGSPAAEDIAAIPLTAIPGWVWPDAVARLTGEVAAEPRPPHTRPASPRPRPRLLLAAGAALPVAAFGCWALASGAVSAYPVSASRSGTGVPASGPAGPATMAAPDRVREAPRAAGTEPPNRPAAPTRPPTVPILALLPTTPTGTVLPVVTPSTVTEPAPTASPTESPSPSPSSAAPSPSPSPSSAAPSPSETPSPSASASSAAASPSASPSPSDSTADPDPSPTS